MPALRPLQRLLPVQAEHLEAAGGAGGGRTAGGSPSFTASPGCGIRRVPSMRTAQLPSSGAGAAGLPWSHGDINIRVFPGSSIPAQLMEGDRKAPPAAPVVGWEGKERWMGEARGRGHQGWKGKLWSMGNCREKCDGKANLGGFGLQCTSTVQQEQTQIPKDLMY